MGIQLVGLLEFAIERDRGRKRGKVMDTLKSSVYAIVAGEEESEALV